MVPCFTHAPSPSTVAIAFLSKLIIGETFKGQADVWATYAAHPLPAGEGPDPLAVYRDLIAFFGRFAIYDHHWSWCASAGVIIAQHCLGVIVLHPGREAHLNSVALQLSLGLSTWRVVHPR